MRPPIVNTEPAKIDESGVRNIPGFVKVVREGSFVGVVAKTEWAAIQAAAPEPQLVARLAVLDLAWRQTRLGTRTPRGRR